MYNAEGLSRGCYILAEEIYGCCNKNRRFVITAKKSYGTHIESIYDRILFADNYCL